MAVYRGKGVGSQSSLINSITRVQFSLPQPLGAKNLKAQLKRLYIALYKEIGWLRDKIWSNEKGSGMEVNDLVKKLSWHRLFSQ